MTNALEAAHTYARRGWGIVPLYGVRDGVCACPTGAACPSAGKHPHGRGGSWNILKGGADVQAWFDDNPDDNLGIVTGPDSGIFVVDVDGPVGYESLADLSREHGPLPATRIVRTGSGGAHLFYRHPGHFVVHNSTSYLAKNIDIRGKGGQVVAPPSVSGAGAYEVISDVDVADAPDWLLRLLHEHTTRLEHGQKAEIRIAEHVDVELLPERVATLARQHVGMDEGRFKHFHSLVAACYEAGYTQGQAVTIAAPWCAAVGKFVGRVEQEVARCWGKLEAESQRANEWIAGLGDRPTGVTQWDDATPTSTATLAPTAVSGGLETASSSTATDSVLSAGDASTLSPELPASWAPQDVAAVLDGTYVPPAPDLFPRTDGHCLLYRGLVHSFHGESESGKSLIAQWEVSRVLREGGFAAYIDFESDISSVVNRLRMMGAPEDGLVERFTYRRPDSDPFAMPKEREAFADLLRQELDVVVIDGVTDALGIFGAGSNDMDEVTQVMRRFPRKVAERTGAAVVLIDHVAKDSETRGRHAVGSQAKLNGLDGAAYVIDVGQTFGQGMIGSIVMRVGKDRPGGVRPHAKAEHRRDRTQEVARVTVDSKTVPGTIQLVVGCPEGSTADAASSTFDRNRPTTVMEEVSRIIEENGPLTGTRLENLAPRGASIVRTARKVLQREGYLVQAKDDRGYDAWATSRPYRAAEDEASADYLGWIPSATPSDPVSTPSGGGETTPVSAPLLLRSGAGGEGGETGPTPSEDLRRGVTIVEVSCKGCFRPTVEAVANAFGGLCGNCAGKAGLV